MTRPSWRRYLSALVGAPRAPRHAEQRPAAGRDVTDWPDALRGDEPTGLDRAEAEIVRLRAGWRDADHTNARAVSLLLWLHAEARWLLTQHEAADLAHCCSLTDSKETQP